MLVVELSFANELKALLEVVAAVHGNSDGEGDEEEDADDNDEEADDDEEL